MTPEPQKPSAGAVSAAVPGSARSPSIRFLETLDQLSEGERRHLLRVETTDEIAGLYTLAVNDYGYDSPAAHTLASVLDARLTAAAAAGQNSVISNTPAALSPDMNRQ